MHSMHVRKGSGRETLRVQLDLQAFLQSCLHWKLNLIKLNRFLLIFVIVLNFKGTKILNEFGAEN